MRIDEIKEISIDNYDGPENERGVDFSIMNGISTCPFYGIIRYIHNKTFSVVERNLALECGDLCHKCFACYRALSIYFRGVNENKQTLKDIGANNVIKIFQEVVNNELDFEYCKEIFTQLLKQCEEVDTMLSKYTLFSDFIIDNSGYYDDPEDKKRTIANIKDSLLHYLSNFLSLVEDEPVWIEDENDINSKVGIEIPFNLNVKIKFIANDEEFTKVIHFIGKLDGVHVRIKDNNSLIIHENKTASRLDDSWLGQWYKSHQITGYCLAGYYFTKQECLQARVLGMQIPAPKTSGYAFRMERVDREQFNFNDWARWVLTVNEFIEDYKDCPEKAVMNTHACCRYYKQCSFVPLCCSNVEERKRILEEEMITDEWNPLESD